LACRIFTLAVLVCLLTSSLGSVPVLLSIVAAESQSASEEHETQSDVRCHCARQMRLRFVPLKTARSLHDRFALKGLHRGWRLPRPLFLPCFIGSGIRLLC
jgi:hypothetical protein